MPSNSPLPGTGGGSVQDDTAPTLGGNLDGGGFAVTNIGNVDGRDVSADGAKLDTIETSATADQTGAEIKVAYEAEANTNAFTDAEKTKLAGIAAGATANPRTALSIFEATLSSATQNCNGTQGSTFDFTWTTSVNNATYITSFTNGNSVITLTEAGEYLVAAQIIVLNSALTGRLIFTGQIIHQDSTPTTLWDQTLGAPYIRDGAANYDSGGLGGQQTIFASAGDRLILRRTVLDTANSASNVYASQTDTKIRVQKID